LSYERLVVKLALAPPAVSLDDLAGVLSPDQAVVAEDHFDFEAEVGHVGD